MIRGGGFRHFTSKDWVWHCLLESVTWDPSSSSLSPNSASSLPTWRRGDSKLDWAARYASIYSQDPLAIKESEVDEDGKTFQEEREEKWKEENEEAERQSNDKSVQRDYYKVCFSYLEVVEFVLILFLGTNSH